MKMAAVNLFFHGMWNCEVMCANALLPGDFVIAYRISGFPLGIFKIEEKEKCRSWHRHNVSFQKRPDDESIQLSTIPFHERPKDDGIQMDLFGTPPPA